jgi:hypothetical protein
VCEEGGAGTMLPGMYCMVQGTTAAVLAGPVRERCGKGGRCGKVRQVRTGNLSLEWGGGRAAPTMVWAMRGKVVVARVLWVTLS